MKKKDLRARIAELNHYLSYLEGQNTDLRTILIKADLGELEQELHSSVSEAAAATMTALGARLAHNEIKEKQGRGRKAGATRKAGERAVYLTYQPAYFRLARKKIDTGMNERDACGAARKAIIKKIERETGAAPKSTAADELFPTYEKWPDSERI